MEENKNNSTSMANLPIVQLQVATITNSATTTTATAAVMSTPMAPVTTTTAPQIIQTTILPMLTETAANDAANEKGILDSPDKPQAQSDDSDTTLQSELDIAETRALITAVSSESKEYTSQQTLDEILHANSGQAITAGRIEVDHISSGNVCIGEQRDAKQSGGFKIVQRVEGGIPGEGGASVESGDAGENTIANENETTPTGSIRSIGSLVCRICHNSENPDKLVSPCLCKGSLTYVHIYCLERWISTSRSTVCELCQFQYNTEQTLRYTCFQSLRMWYSRSMSRRALQEDCQMFSLLTLVAFGIIGTLLVGIQYYFLQGRTWGLSRVWTKGWLIFFLLTTVLAIYFINIYMIVRSQLTPWYRWWQSARDIKLILENRKPFKFRPNRRLQNRQVATDLSDISVLNPPSQHVFEPTYPEQRQPPEMQPIPPPPPPPPPPPAAPPTTAHIALSAVHVCASDDELSCSKLPPPAATAVRCVALTTAATIEMPLEGYLYELDSVI